MAKVALSLFIITRNEALRLPAVLQAARPIAAEIIVVDSGSSDDTVKIAEASGAKVIFNAWHGYGPQKRFAEEQCAHDWVLNLDADEVLSEALVQEINTLFANGAPELDGYYLQIKDCLPGEIEAGRFAHTTKAVRLYNKTRGRYAQSMVHDRVQFPADAKLGSLQSPVWHRSIVNMEQAIMKLNRYSTMQAQDMRARGKTLPMLTFRLYTEWPTAFFKSYILRLDILRGRAGFINSVTYAFSRFARIVKMMESNQ